MRTALTLVFAIIMLSAAAMAQECSLELTSPNTQAFLNEIASLNEQTQKCPIALPDAAKLVFGDEIVQLDIVRSLGTESVLFTNQGGVLKSIERKSGGATYLGTIKECAMDAMLGAETRAGALAFLILNNHVEIKGLTLWRRLKLFAVRPFLNMYFKKVQTEVPVNCEGPAAQGGIGPYQGKRVCDFYQQNKKLVSCEVSGTADNFCLTVMGSPHARAEKCDNGGQIICSLPCDMPPGTVTPTMCPFDNDRARGKQAAPLSWCPTTATTSAQPAKKPAGALCNHGGECQTGNCVGEGQGPPWTYRCSCDPFRYVGGPCPTTQTSTAPPGQKKNPGDVCQHGGECRTGNCVGVGSGPPWTYKCSCHPSRFETGC